MWAQISFVLSQCTRLTDRRTDGRTERPSQYRALHHMQWHGKMTNQVNGPRFAYSLYNFHGATRKIKVSLLMNIPIVKRFGGKIWRGYVTKKSGSPATPYLESPTPITIQVSWGYDEEVSIAVVKRFLVENF